MKTSLERYIETGYSVPVQRDSYSVQKIGPFFHVVNPSGVVIGKTSRRFHAVAYANRQNKANNLLPVA